MRKIAIFSFAVLAVTCGPSPDAKLPNFPGMKGGTTGSGGVHGSGGSVGSGGTQDEGGAGGTGSGGTAGSGGTTQTGGSKAGTGGRAGAGGKTTGEDAGPDGRRDGPRGTGGEPGDGGTTGTSRDAGRGGTPDAARDVFGGRDSIVGSGGIGGRDAPIGGGDAVAASCYATIVENGYTCGTIAPCSECKDTNGVSKDAECQKGIDCLAAAGPSCDSNCQLGCLNKAGDSTVHTCINALTKVACGGTGC